MVTRYKNIIFTSLVFVIYLALAFATTEEDNTPWNEKDASSMAYIMTEDWVKERLVSPGSAIFPGYVERRDHVTNLGNQKYLIRSYVDSQNSLGGLVRSNFVAEVHQTEENNWRLISLELTQR